MKSLFERFDENEEGEVGRKEFSSNPVLGWCGCMIAGEGEKDGKIKETGCYSG